MDQYSTKKTNSWVVYPAAWHLPSDEDFRAKFTKTDISKMLRSRIIGKFTGKANDYERLKAAFYLNVHVQCQPPLY